MRFARFKSWPGLQGCQFSILIMPIVDTISCHFHWRVYGNVAITISTWKIRLAASVQVNTNLVKTRFVPEAAVNFDLNLLFLFWYWLIELTDFAVVFIATATKMGNSSADLWKLKILVTSIHLIFDFQLIQLIVWIIEEIVIIFWEKCFDSKYLKPIS